MKKLIDRLVKRLYYKRFPDRVNDYALARTPIPVVREERYRPEKLIAEVHIPYEAYKMDRIPKEWIRKELSIKLAQGIEDQIKIEQVLEPRLQQYIYRGYIKILKED